MPISNERDYYARRAKEVCDLAEAALEPDIRKILIDMAASYEKLVEEADRIARLRSDLDNVTAPVSATSSATTIQPPQ